MPRYQLAIAIVLAVSAACSAALFFWLSPPSGGKIELPTSNDSDDEFEPELAGESDPFAVTKPEDFIDGTPIDEDKFWVEVSLMEFLLYYTTRSELLFGPWN
jgi:hypothetical protein